MENDKISKIEDKEYPDFDLKNCDKENIVIKTKSENGKDIIINESLHDFHMKKEQHIRNWKYA